MSNYNYIDSEKKMSVMKILEILQKYTDEKHTLTPTQIQEKLQKEYGITVNRKTVPSNITDLIDYGYDIQYEEKPRKNGTTVKTNYFINRKFTDEELRFIIDALAFIKFAPFKQRQALIQKLESLSTVYFQKKVKHINALDPNYINAGTLFFNMQIIDEDIEQGCKISFKYMGIDTDKKYYAKTKNGEEIIYEVSPYQLVMVACGYYLMAFNENTNNIEYYRIDRIKDIKCIENSKVYPIRYIQGYETELDMRSKIAKSEYMFPGRAITVIFEANRDITTQIVDRFGSGARFIDEKKDTVKVIVESDPRSIIYWALQYIKDVRVISPQFIVVHIKSALVDALYRYNYPNNDFYDRIQYGRRRNHNRKMNLHTKSNFLKCSRHRNILSKRDIHRLCLSVQDEIFANMFKSPKQVKRKKSKSRL